ncbi:MAG: GNAT family N-acetyltransferase [Candidatus Kapaibacterium sp.]
MVRHDPTSPITTFDMNQTDSVNSARTLILRYGRNSTAYQIINPGFLRWFASDEMGLVGYVSRGKTIVAAGEPVSPIENSLEVATRFELNTLSGGIKRVCWFCASSEFASHFRERSDYATVVIGAQPVWNPKTWREKIEGHPSLRAQLHRARNKGVEVEEWPKEKALNHPELQQCLNEWLDDRPFPPLHFLVEPQTLDRLFDRRVFVAEWNQKVVGFVLLSPVPLRNGWLVEQFVRRRAAPNGTVELLLDQAIRTISGEGYTYVTLGLAPLSRRANITATNPPLIRFLFGWLRLHGRRFYKFDGLDFFKAKFSPDYWEPIWGVVNEPRFSLRTLYAIAAAFSNGSPIRSALLALLKALRQEGRWLALRLQSRGD